MFADIDFTIDLIGYFIDSKEHFLKQPRLYNSLIGIAIYKNGVLYDAGEGFEPSTSWL
jgi:hypothetical protein